jgi:hypothetical protein
MLVGGSGALDNAVRWVARRQQYYAEIVREGRADKETFKEIDGIIDVCQLLDEQISLMKEARPAEISLYDNFLAQVEQARVALKTVEVKAKKSLIGM